MAQFKFQSLEVWQLSIAITDKLLDIADRLSVDKKYRFAEQLNGLLLAYLTILPKVQALFQIRNLLII
jgi:hypothetical protein